MSEPTPAPVAAETPKKIEPVLRRYMKQMLEDSLAISAAHLHSHVRRDRAFCEQVIRYLAKVARHSHPPAIFHQSCVGGAWSEIKEVPVAEPNSARLYPNQCQMASQLAAIRVDGAVCELVVFVLNYVHTAGPYMNVELSTVISLVRRSGAPKERIGKQSEKAFIEAVVEHSDLIDQNTMYKVVNLAEWSPEAQTFLTAELAAIEKARLDLGTEYAKLLFDKDLYDVAAAVGIHKTVLDADAATPLGPTMCFLIKCGPTIPTSCLRLTAEDLDRLVIPNPMAPLGDPIIEAYAKARDLISLPRERGDAVVIYQRYLDGVLSAYCYVVDYVIQFAKLGPAIDSQMEARKSLAKTLEDRRAEAGRAAGETKESEPTQ